MKIWVIICILIALLGIIAIIMIIEYHKYQWLITKLNKGENKLHKSLENKHQILLNYLAFLKDNISLPNTEFDEYQLINNNISLLEFDKLVTNFDNQIKTYINDNEKLLKKEELIIINNNLEEANSSIQGYKKYYNENISTYNNLLKSFPTNIVGKIFKYQTKDYLEEQTDEHFKILDE